MELPYSQDIDAGENSVLIAYHTYRHDYYCTFVRNAAEHTGYEVTTQETLFPLTLFRCVRTNSLWASRLDPTDPFVCITQQRR